MRTRISRAVAAAAAVTMPLLAGCGASSAPESSSAAPALTQTAAPDDTAASATPSPSSDQAQETEDVQAATQKFVKTVLTVGYPDKTFDEYLERIEPLMTKGGFAALKNTGSRKRGTDTLKSLYPQRARSAPTFTTDPVVVSLESGRASAKLDYENVGQQKQGADWKTVKSLGKGSVTVKLVKDDGKWLVDNAS